MTKQVKIKLKSGETITIIGLTPNLVITPQNSFYRSDLQDYLPLYAKVRSDLTREEFYHHFMHAIDYESTIGHEFEVANLNSGSDDTIAAADLMLGDEQWWVDNTVLEYIRPNETKIERNKLDSFLN